MNHVIPRILVLEGLSADTAGIVEDAGAVAVEASPWDFKAVQRHLKSGLFDGLVLTGGSDVNPARYGETPGKWTQMPDNTRDYVELSALAYARKNRMPVLGICRGSQIMCVSRGGKLTQDIETALDPIFRHTGDTHEVCVTSKAQTLRRACLGDEMVAISLHHQCVASPGNGMRIAAMAIDGTPEAIESKDGLMLGVQFHPEITAYGDPQAFAIFRWLVERAAMRKGGKAVAASFQDAVARYRAAEQSSYCAYLADMERKRAHGEYWFDDSASIAGSTTRTSRPHRAAGDPSLPSRRAPSSTEMVRLIESSIGHSVTLLGASGEVIDGTATELPSDTPRSEHLLERLLVCSHCHIRFDCIEDCDDHRKFVHPDPEPEPDHWHSRYPDMHEPPAGHQDWEVLEDSTREMLLRDGFDPRDWEYE